MTFRMDPRAKLYLLLLANLLLLFHVGTAAEAATTALCLLLFFLCTFHTFMHGTTIYNPATYRSISSFRHNSYKSNLRSN